MSKWRELDLSRCWGHPAEGQLTALLLKPTNDRATFYAKEKYDIGRFSCDAQTGRKLWWHGTHGCEDPVRLKKHYEIWWYPIDGINDFDYSK